jgi:hypothetical protein
MLMINEKNSSEENYFPARLAQTRAIEILNYISPPTTERDMTRPHWTDPAARKSTNELLKHPMIWDRRTLREALDEWDRQQGLPAAYAPPLTWANIMESAFP